MLTVMFISLIFLIIIGIPITKKLFNPLTVYNGVWFIVIFFYQFRLSRLQRELSSETIILLLFTSIVFSISFLLTYIFKIHDSHKNTESTIIEQTRIDSIFRIWLIVEIFETIVSGGLPLLWKLTGNPKTYMNFGVPSLHGLMNAVGLVLMMLCFYTILYTKDKKEKQKNKIYLCFIVFFYLMLITRQVIISAIIQMVIIYIFSLKKIPWKKIFALLIIIVISFGILGNIRTGYTEFLRVSLIRTSIPPIFIGLYWFYMYFTMSIANINNAVQLGINHYGGAYSAIRSFLPTVISNLFLANKNVYIPNYLVTNAYNVSGYFINFYVGYGNKGVYFIAFIYGIIGGRLLRNMQKSFTEKTILYYAVYMQIIILSFFYNHLLYLPSGFQFLVIYTLFSVKLKWREK